MQLGGLRWLARFAKAIAVVKLVTFSFAAAYHRCKVVRRDDCREQKRSDRIGNQHARVQIGVGDVRHNAIRRQQNRYGTHAIQNDHNTQHL